MSPHHHGYASRAKLLLEMAAVNINVVFYTLPPVARGGYL